MSEMDNRAAEFTTDAEAYDAPAEVLAQVETSRARRAAGDRGRTDRPARASGNDPVRALVADSATAKRVSLYLHPDDYRMLGREKFVDGIQLNARIRAMIAVYRANPRFRTAVDAVAKTAPW